MDSSGPNGIGNLTASLPDLAIPAGENLKVNVSFTVNATNQVGCPDLLPSPA